MQELEKILEEVNRLIEKHKNNAYELVAKEPLTQCYTETDIEQTKVHELAVVRDIIRKHMDHASDRWIPVEERLPEKPENGYQEPEYNVMIKDAIIPTTLKFTSKGKWKDDLGQEYEIIAWRPLPEPYRPEGSDCDGK